VFLGAKLAAELIREIEPSCSACGEKLLFVKKYAIVYGKPSVVCDSECYDMLRSNWQPTRGRI
jgi:hypothetical protein